ncbi:MAG: hypothetical protein F6K65_11180 [Moorea sp. SIO3C2]|nr:hypothetical protein [Moorena sp. SIO3C2]
MEGTGYAIAFGQKATLKAIGLRPRCANAISNLPQLRPIEHFSLIYKIFYNLLFSLIGGCLNACFCFIIQLSE